jgi:hypothetical protein
MIGPVGVPVNQAAPSLCDLQHNGNINVADVQIIINEALHWELLRPSTI